MIHTFSTYLPGEYDESEPEVAVTADCVRPMPPSFASNHDAVGYSDPGSPGECVLVSVEVDRGVNILPDLPGWVREQLARETWEDFDR